MLNHIWAFMIAIGILVGAGMAVRNAATGQEIKKTVDGKEVVEFKTYPTLKEKVAAISEAGTRLTKDAINSAAFRYTDPATGSEKSGAVGIAIDLIGIMALWLGFMKLAEASGLIQLLARAIRPLFKAMFPKVPVEHPAAGAILMNFAANMLGLDNAATPLGIKAMKELQELNGDKETASNAMCMFLCLNVSSLALLPASIIAYRASADSVNPTGFWVPMLMATSVGTLCAFTMCKIAERFSRDTPPAIPAQTQQSADEAPAGA